MKLRKVEVGSDRKNGWLRVVGLLVACVCGLSVSSLAQTGTASWANLNALHPGQKVQVVQMNSTKHSGVFVAVTDAAIQIQEDASQLKIARQDVRSVKLPEHKKRARNALIGAAVGAGAGAGIGAAAWNPHGFLGGRGVGAGVGALIGVGAGALIGALIASHTTIYSAAGH